MQITQLQESIISKFDVQARLGDVDAEINMLLLIENDSGANELKNALYAVHENELRGLEQLPANILLVYATARGKAYAAERIEAEPDLNVFYVSASCYNKLANYIQSRLELSKNAANDYIRFLRMIINNWELSYVLTEASKQCGNQLVAVDFSGKIFAYSSRSGKLDSYWDLFFKNGFLPASSMQHFYECFMARSDISAKPYRYVCDESGLIYYSSPILINNYPYGYVFMLTWDSEVRDSIYELLPILSRVAGDYIKRKDPELNTSTRMYRNLISDILAGESAESISSRFKIGGYTAPKMMRVLFIKSYFVENETEIYNTLIAQLSVLFTSVPPVIHDSGLVLVQNCSDYLSAGTDDTFGHLLEIANANRLHIGVSNPFSDMCCLADYYAQASEALALSDRRNYVPRVVFYKDVAFYSLLCKLKSEFRAVSTCHPALKVLMDYDKENNTELYNTAKVYVETNRNQKLTSEQLFTHRNTILYRKQKIVELTGIDFDDPEELFQLNYSFRICSFLG